MSKGFMKNLIKKMLNQDFFKKPPKSKSRSEMEETGFGNNLREKNHGLELTKGTI